jgi:hypothetical protein
MHHHRVLTDRAHRDEFPERRSAGQDVEHGDERATHSATGASLGRARMANFHRPDEEVVAMVRRRRRGQDQRRPKN